MRRRVEVGTFHGHSALGSVVDHNRGVATGYPKGDILQDWHGNPIGRVRVISRRKNPRGIFSNEVVSYRAWIDGVEYYGRGGGDGMLLRLKRKK